MAKQDHKAKHKPLPEPYKDLAKVSADRVKRNKERKWKLGQIGSLRPKTAEQRWLAPKIGNSKNRKGSTDLTWYAKY